MANVLDIRRRIRSVKNTRQITKAMKMVSAAKLRRAQERAMAARPCAQMLTNVLKSLVSRADLYDPETGEPAHPLLIPREEKNILLLVVTGDKGLAGAFNTNILKAAAKFIATKSGKNIDVVAVGRKGRDYFKRRYPYAPKDSAARRAGAIEIAGEHVGILNRVPFARAREIAEDVIARYSDERIDAAYILYNESKSVISQRLVVDEVLPIAEIGEAAIQMTEEQTEQERKRSIEAARTSGVGVRAADTSAADEKAA